LLTQRREDEQLDDEIDAHLDLLKQHYISRGMSGSDAERTARRQFGNVTTLKQKQRAQRGFLSPPEWWGDTRFGLRMLRKKWASNAAVVVALALGIGMNAAVFTFMNALLLRPPAGVPAIGNLFEVWLHSRTGTGVQSYFPFDYPDYFYYRDHTKSLEGLLAFDGDGQEAIWNRAGEGQIIHGQLVSGNYFSLLGINPPLGRAISTGDDAPATPRHVAMLSDSFWRREMGADPAAVGRTMVLNGAEFDVIGVAPKGFTGLMVGTDPDFWVPLSAQERFTHDKSRTSDRNGYWLIVAGRLKPGIDKVKVQAEMQVLGRQLEAEHPNAENQFDLLVYPATLIPGPYRGYVGAFTGLLLAVFSLVLLIACTNAASLLLARSSGRIREMAIRSALGAGRARLIRQMLIESLQLSLIAGAAAVMVAWIVARLLLRLKPSSLPITLELPLDWRVLMFTLAVSVTAGVLFGIVPALRNSAVNAAPVLKEETQSAGFRKSRMRNLLLVVEIAICVVLLAGATLCVRSLRAATSIDPGFETRHIALTSLNPGALGYSHEKVNAFYQQLLERVRNLPGVTSASYADHLPLGSSSEQTSASIRAGDKANEIGVSVFRVDPGYFGTMGIPLLAGRDLTPKEAGSATPDVVVVNEYLARRLWPGENPVGKRLSLGGEKTASEVIGVVPNGKYRTLGEGPVAALFRGTLPPPRTLIVRTSGSARSLLEPLRREVQIVDPMMAATDAQTVEDYMELPLFPARTTGLLLGSSGILALVLTTIGLFGVIAYVVSQRTREIGIRMALGARRTDVLKLVMRQGLFVIMIGLVIGLCAAIAATRLLSPLLYGIGASDPLTFIAVALGLAAVAMLACYLPARRAMGVDPSAALRYE
jgi:predicted permease